MSNTITIYTTETISKAKEVSLPAYFKRANYYTKVISKDHSLEICTMDLFLGIQKKLTNLGNNEIEVSQEEFNTVYHDTLIKLGDML